MEERSETQSHDFSPGITVGVLSEHSVPSRLSLLRQIRALGTAARECNVGSTKVVGTALNEWTASDFPRLPPSGLQQSKRLAKRKELRTFVESLRGLGFLEASYWLSSAYSMLADESQRKRLAMYFTPPSLTKGLLDDLENQGVDFSSASFMDPACGGAAFLAPVAIRMRDALARQGHSAKSILKHIEGKLFGTDLDSTLCALSKHFLRMALHTEIAAAKFQPAFCVHKADSLRQLAPMFGHLDVVVCNPPYRKMEVDELAPLRKDFGEVIESQPNLYGLFIALCVRLLREDGRAALVTPTSFLSGQYFSSLRRYLAANAAIEHIGMVSDRLGVFIDVEQETALTVMRKKAAPQAASEAATDVSVVSTSGQYQSVGQCQLPGDGTVWPIPRGVEDLQLLREMSRSGFRIADYGYRVRIGAFVWNRDERPTYTCSQSVRRARCKTAVPLLWSGDISLDGKVRFDGSRPKDDEHRFVDLGSRIHGSVVRRPCVVLQRVTSNTQSRRLVAAAVPQSIFRQYGGFVGENHLVVLEPEVSKPAISPSQMARLLATPCVDRYFRCISGATNVSSFELGQLPLPDPQLLQRLLKQGVEMSAAVSEAFGL